jgi:hypothetical protein
MIIVCFVAMTLIMHSAEPYKYIYNADDVVNTTFEQLQNIKQYNILKERYQKTQQVLALRC